MVSTQGPLVYGRNLQSARHALASVCSTPSTTEQTFPVFRPAHFSSQLCSQRPSMMSAATNPKQFATHLLGNDLSLIFPPLATFLTQTGVLLLLLLLHAAAQLSTLCNSHRGSFMCAKQWSPVALHGLEWHGSTHAPSVVTASVQSKFMAVFCLHSIKHLLAKVYEVKAVRVHTGSHSLAAQPHTSSPAVCSRSGESGYK
mmetsp:Transcript_8980/g.13290  ORF Transcript_8980/g.13290 Transcript_8980/m.13290 type:complete len:200 (-) Transcript_8980:18-617(-)